MSGTYRSGRRPVPTAIHVLRGTSARHRDREPKIPPGRPAPPPEIEVDPAAFEHWNVLAARLEAVGVLTPSHREALGLLAQALADHGRVRAQLHEMGYRQLIVDEMHDKSGKVIRRRIRENPLIRRSERLALLCSRLLGEFGLTPITQTKVQADAKPQVSRAQRYLGG